MSEPLAKWSYILSPIWVHFLWRRTFVCLKVFVSGTSSFLDLELLSTQKLLATPAWANACWRQDLRKYHFCLRFSKHSVYLSTHLNVYSNSYGRSVILCYSKPRRQFLVLCTSNLSQLTNNFHWHCIQFSAYLSLFIGLHGNKRIPPSNFKYVFKIRITFHKFLLKRRFHTLDSQSS